MAVKGFYDNPQEATTPALTDLLGIQQGNTLADMKKITYENLVKPLEEAKLDKIATPVENAIVVQNADGTLKNSNVNITDPTFDSVGADEFDIGSQVVEAAMIPSTTDEMLRLKNMQAGKVHTIMELRSPDTGDTEATLSLHTVPNGIDDWVFDLSFHNYSTFMKMVSVISHFTGENAGSWEWVSRYTDGTDYSMIERMLMKLDGQTGYLMVGESGDATARFHAKQVGYLDKPAIKAEIDSTHETQPPALHATDTTNHAQTGVLVKFSMLNATDTGVVLKLENAGTGAYINADDKFVVDKDGNIASPTISAIKGTGYTEGSLKTHEDRLGILEGTDEGSVAKAIDDYAIPLVPAATAGNLAVFGSEGEVVDSGKNLVGEAWITPTLLNGWTEVAGYPVRYMKDAFGFYHQKGRITGGTLGTNAFILPVGYRPLVSVGFALFTFTGTFGSADLSAGGGFRPLVGNTTAIYLDNVSFKIEA